nr:hypothetical protein GCM10020092_081430 [Actinoplanes digitatis]
MASRSLDLDTPWLDSTRRLLLNERFAAELDRNDVLLRLGRHGELLPALSAAAAEYPLDERLAEQSMLALYRCGRQADADEQYRRIRRGLADELGSDPGTALRRLHERILAADPTLDVPVGDARGPGVQLAAPTTVLGATAERTCAPSPGVPGSSPRSTGCSRRPTATSRR